MFTPWRHSFYLQQVPQEGCGTHLLQKLICILGCVSASLPSPRLGVDPGHGPARRIPGLVSRPRRVPRGGRTARSPSCPRALAASRLRADGLSRLARRSPGPPPACPLARGQGPRPPERAVGRSIRRAVPRRVHTLSPAAPCAPGRAPGGWARRRRSRLGPPPR